ncbi:MAG: Thioredoxin 1 [Holosporales bacterium]
MNLKQEEMMLNATDQTFKEIVQNTDKPVVIDFWAPWCGPCRMLAPVFEEVGQALSTKATFIKVNVDEANQVSSAFNVTSIPALVIVKDGSIVARLAGVQRADALTKWVESNI